MIRTALALAIGLGGLGWTSGGWAEGEQLLLGRDPPLESAPEQPLAPNDDRLAAPPQPILDPAAAGGPALAASPSVGAPEQLPARPSLPTDLVPPTGPVGEPPLEDAPSAAPQSPPQAALEGSLPGAPQIAAPSLPSYFSARLGASFLMEQMFLPQFGQFAGARLVSDPLPGSPLEQLGLGAGDLITRLDGIPLVRAEELERHVLQTTVRFIRNGEQHVCIGMMFVDPYGCFLPAQCENATCPLGNGGPIAFRP